MTRVFLLTTVVVAGALAAGGCAKAKARTLPAPPPVVAPAPPLDARAMPVTVLPSPPAVAPAPVGAWLAAPVDPAERHARPAGRPDEPVLAPPARPVDRPRLGTPETADADQATRRIGGMLARARASLAKVDPDRLSADARVQYQTARLLIDQAEAAMQARNFMYATRLADKAETLARQLEKGQ
jgi:hypothetical protein